MRNGSGACQVPQGFALVSTLKLRLPHHHFLEPHFAAFGPLRASPVSLAEEEQRLAELRRFDEVFSAYRHRLLQALASPAEVETAPLQDKDHASDEAVEVPHHVRQARTLPREKQSRCSEIWSAKSTVPP